MRNYRNNIQEKVSKFPVEVKILMYIYHLDIKSINYKKLLHFVCLISSFDIAILFCICSLFSQGYIQLIVLFLLVFPVIFGSYFIFYKICELKSRRN